MRRGWHLRGYLPHFDGEETTQFVTFRLGDALPEGKLATWRTELASRPRGRAEAELRKRVERYLDGGEGRAVTRQPRPATIVEGVLRHRDREQYDLHAWVVMPNHVHVLFTPREGFELPAIVQAWKSVSARRTNRVLASRGRLWQEDYFDRFIRNARHFHEVVGYIEWNPVDAGLCECPEEWPFGSARLGVT